MDEQYLKTPQYGSRSYSTWFHRKGIAVDRKKAASMMMEFNPKTPENCIYLIQFKPDCPALLPCNWHRPRLMPSWMPEPKKWSVVFTFQYF